MNDNTRKRITAIVNHLLVVETEFMEVVQEESRKIDFKVEEEEIEVEELEDAWDYYQSTLETLISIME